MQGKWGRFVKYYYTSIVVCMIPEGTQPIRQAVQILAKLILLYSEEH